MKSFIYFIALLFFLLTTAAASAAAAPAAKDDSLEVDATRIKANKELPKVLYVVPWKDMETNKNTDQKLVLQDFFGDLYDPVLVSSTPHAVEKKSTSAENNTK